MQGAEELPDAGIGDLGSWGWANSGEMQMDELEIQTLGGGKILCVCVCAGTVAKTYEVEVDKWLKARTSHRFTHQG